MKTRHTFTATLLVALLAIAGVTAAIAADPADPPPPRIAFVANGRVPADALAAGPIAGQLGAPVYTTEQHVLPDSTADALDDYNPELVIVMGGSVAISDDVVNAIAAATGLPTVEPSPPPTTGVVRAAGSDRFVTATVVADLLSAYDPAYLGVDLQAVDADLLDGKDSSAFQPAGNYLGATAKAADSDKLDGKNSSSFLLRGPIVHTQSDWRAFDGTTQVENFGEISATGGTAVTQYPTPTALLGGVPMSLSSFEFCYDATASSLTGIGVIIRPAAGPPSFLPEPQGGLTNAGCRTQTFSPPIALDPSDTLVGFFQYSGGTMVAYAGTYTLVPTEAGHASAATLPKARGESSLAG